MSTWNTYTLRARFWDGHPHITRRKILGPKRWPVTAPFELQAKETQDAWNAFIVKAVAAGNISSKVAASATLADRPAVWQL